MNICDKDNYIQHKKYVFVAVVAQAQPAQSILVQLLHDAVDAFSSVVALARPEASSPRWLEAAGRS